MLANIGFWVIFLGFSWLLISMENHLKSIDYKLDASSFGKPDLFKIELDLSSIKYDVESMSHSLSFSPGSSIDRIENKLDEIIDELRELNLNK